MRIGGNRERIKIVEFTSQRDSGGGVEFVVKTEVNTTLFGDLVPELDGGDDGNGFEAGVRFRPVLNGYIRGIRFYKLATNLGLHTGSLWTPEGILLARGTFVNETAEGWQEMLFDIPVLVEAGRAYVASYHMESGHYGLTADYFLIPRGNEYIEALEANIYRPNALFSYSQSPSFPESANNGKNANLFVDVLFNTLTPGGVDVFQESFDLQMGFPGEVIYWETNAQVKDMKDKYKAEVYGVGLEEAIVFTIRNRSDKEVKKDMQVKFRNKYYTIHGIMDDGYRGRELALICKMKE